MAASIAVRVFPAIPEERQGNTGRSRLGQDLAGQGGRLAMGEALTIEARHERGYPIVTVAGGD